MINEWHMMKSLLYTRYGEDLQDRTWSTIHKATEDQGVSSVLSLMDLILSLPPISVFDERSFSHMKLIKDDRRTRLSTASLSDIMVVKAESPAVETFDPSTAISEWLFTPSGRSRRPNQRKWRSKQNVEGQEETHVGQEETMVEQGGCNRSDREN
ncbi:uncharacterized protein LOC125651296 [Ostrea edulis]|uniref:uncharacterized protein LOC125651296 n=1 Tax=Ostrea edulis TaxID=37623 RepID=UPI0024AF66CF|nr:uncharacterized protein LOC125651296 [Ostrea edulis]